MPDDLLMVVGKAIVIEGIDAWIDRLQHPGSGLIDEPANLQPNEAGATPSL